MVTTAYPPDHSGGYELSCRDVVEQWKEAGHEVVVLTSGPAVPTADTRIRRQLHTYFAADHFDSWSWRKTVRAEHQDLRALQAALDELAPDVVSVWHMAGIPMSLLSVLARKQVPLVCVVCDEWPGYLATMDPWMRRWRRLPPLWPLVERITGIPTGIPDLDGSACFCFVSHDLQDRCVKRSGWSFPRSTVTYSGIDPSVFPMLPEAQPKDWSWKLVCAGRLHPDKGFATAIRALTRLPPESSLRILSASDHPYREQLEALARDCGVEERVELSTADRSGVRRSFLDADAVLFPSEWPEPFGLVPIEAMASGVPVVATATGGSAEFLEDGSNCLVFAPGDAEGLAGALGRLSSSAPLRSRLVEGGRATASEFTVGHLAERLGGCHLAAVDRLVSR